ncbi:penicillin-binding protein 1A [Paraburkholderia acidisoli]|uniref:Penicillin-binding protein n=1 Tax=Paraburkholderia acidisoli TaxID=2571748 RepID=A0A7Z2GLJ2_9BURK|nr:transglycosylase domain-containing protein [Paraburkholderia acidisoli]QGZ63715.1 penicillin-binding protein [Paraburkholderia acidisoli]
MLFARLKPAAARFGALLRPYLARAWHHVRHPTKRGVLIAVAALPALLLLYTIVLIPFTPSIGDIRKARVDEPAQILSADGKLLAEFKPSNREWVPLAQISPHMVDALISTEDHRFYEHHGIDFKRTAGAALHTFSGDRQGGSTITQQLARNLYPDEIGRAPTLTRKLKEAITAFKIEAVYSKPQILETYLNTVPFLYNAYGIEMAARTYFGVSADQLDILQSATLTGMLKGNAYYNPVINPERALARRNTVLGQMVKYGKLTPAQFATLSKKPLRLDFERQTETPGPAPHFALQLRKWLISWADRNDYNIYSDGLVVRTTIDSRLQSMATAALRQHAAQLQGVANGAWSGRNGCVASNDLFAAFMRETPDYKRAQDAGANDADALKQLAADRGFMRNLCKTKTEVQAGFLAIDPRSGQIKAWVGSRDFTDEPFDHVQQARRQPGSTFKPFVYGAAYAAGAKPTDTFIDQPVEIPLRGGEIWKPTDDVPPSNRPMTLRDALAYSRNRITAQLVQTVGPDKVANLARAMGVRDSQLDPVPSLALGTSPVTLKEMVSAYSTIANDGTYLEPRMVTRIEDRKGDVLAEFADASPQRALSAEADRTLLDTMRDVVNRGTGASIRSRFGIRVDVAGKTGTTQGNTDGWFILMDPQLVAGAWVGFDDGRVTLDDYWGQGARSALPIVGDFFQRALRSRLVDPRARFDTEVTPGAFETFRDKLRAWIDSLTGSHEAAPAPAAPPHRAPSRAPAPASAPGAVVSPASAASSVTEVWESGGGVPSAASGASATRDMGLPPILGPASAPSPAQPAQPAPPSYPAQEPSLAPTPTPDVTDPDTPGASASYTPPVAQPQGQ